MKETFITTRLFVNLSSVVGFNDWMPMIPKTELRLTKYLEVHKFPPYVNVMCPVHQVDLLFEVSLLSYQNSYKPGKCPTCTWNSSTISNVINSLLDLAYFL